MSGMTMLFLRLAVGTLFVVGCGSSSLSAPKDASDSGSPGAVDATPTPRSETGGIGQILRESPPKEVVEGIIDSCTWEPGAVGGPVELNLRESRTTFRLQNSSGTMYRPGGRASEISVNVGGRESRTIHTAKFPLGAEDVDLIVSCMRPLMERVLSRREILLTRVARGRVRDTMKQ